jgi:hypothetical protein
MGVTFVSNIIVMCHWSPNVSQETSYDRLSMMSGGDEGGQKVLSKPSADSCAVGRRQKCNEDTKCGFRAE